MRDTVSNGIIKKVIAPIDPGTGDTAIVGAIIDHLGWESALYIIMTGILADADATWTVLLEESDASNMSGSNAVADADMISQTLGTAAEAAAAFAFGDDGEVRVIGYTGKKRYTRLTITPANNTGSQPLAAVCRLGHGRIIPVTQPAN